MPATFVNLTITVRLVSLSDVMFLWLRPTQAFDSAFKLTKGCNIEIRPSCQRGLLLTQSVARKPNPPCSFCGVTLDRLKALTNKDTLFRTQMFPRLPAYAKFVADTNFVSGRQKMFLILLRNILCPQQMFPSLRSPRNIMGNIVSATMCRLPGPGCSKPD